jgi:hypothetical protein
VQVLNNHDQATFLVQLSCLKSWIRCEEITTEKYYYGYCRTRVLCYIQAVNQKEYPIDHELAIITEILSDRYEAAPQELVFLYGNLTPAQKELARQLLRSFCLPASGILIDTAPAANTRALLNAALYSLHYILA